MKATPEQRGDDLRPAPRRAPVVLVTGGAGFLGRALLPQLLALSEESPLHGAEVRVLDRREPELRHRRLRFVPGDVRSPADLARACRGVDLVLHLAALVDWGQNPAEEVAAVNVEGTRNLLAAAAAAGVRGLLHVSTLDVVYGGGPLRGADEGAPYPAAGSRASVYCRTKAEAERLVRAADDPRGGGLRTVVLRPACIWGEGDPYHLGNLVRMASRFPLVRIGDGRARCSHVYVGNMAHALLLAAGRLWAGDEAVCGGLYFVADQPDRNFFDLFAPVLERAGYRVLPWSLAVPHRPLRLLGALLEDGAALLRPLWRITPTITRFAVDFVCEDFTVSAERARRELGYTPRYSEEEAVARTASWFMRREG